MKMSKIRKSRIAAIILAVLMVFSVVPLAAFNAGAATINGTATSGEKITVSQTYSSAVSYAHTQILDVKYHYALLKQYRIEGVYASDGNYGDNLPVLPIQDREVSISYEAETAAADKNLMVTINNQLTALKTGTDQIYPVKSMPSEPKNQLKNVTVSYYGQEQKTLHLYARVSESNYMFANPSGYPSQMGNGETLYRYLGQVTLQPNSISLKLNYTSSQIGVGRTVTLIADAGVPAGNVVYLATPKNCTGIASVSQVSGQPNIFQITANQFVTSGNQITITAYLLRNNQYVYRNNKGEVMAGDFATATNTAAGNRPVSASQTVYFSTVSPITSLSFGQARYELEVGDSIYTSVKAYPSGATGSITYISSNPSVAEVSSSGAVTGKAVGEATITAIASDGSGVSATTYVKVSPMTARVSLDQYRITLYAGDTAQLNATVLPATLANRSVYWTSSNSAVATVKNGVVTGVKEGSAVITAAYTGNMNKSATCYVTVKKAPVRMTMPSTLKLEVGDIQKLKVLVENTDQKDVIFTSDNRSVIQVDEYGIVRAVAPGAAMVTAILVSDENIRANCVIEVTGQSFKPEITVTGKYVKGSKFYWTEGIGAGDIKAALQNDKTVMVEVNSRRVSNKITFSRYAIARMSVYADSLQVKVGGAVYTFDREDLRQMANGYPIYLYNNSKKMIVKYKDSMGQYRGLEITPTRR